MKLSYDPRHNIASIRLCERRGEIETMRVSGALNLDIATDGTVYGIELLNANEQPTGADGGRVVVVDEADGETREPALAVTPFAPAPRSGPSAS